MMKIVVCDDIDGAFQRSSELERLKVAGSHVIYDQVAATGEMLLEQLQSAVVAVAIRDRTLLGREILTSSSGTTTDSIDWPAPNRYKRGDRAGHGRHDHPWRIDRLRRRACLCAVTFSEPADRHSGSGLAPATLGTCFRNRAGRKSSRYTWARPDWNCGGEESSGFRSPRTCLGTYVDCERAASSGATMVGEEELFRKSDILSVHLRRTDFSYNFVNTSRLALMKPTALLIDISWAGIVDHKALATALR